MKLLKSLLTGVAFTLFIVCLVAFIIIPMEYFGLGIFWPLFLAFVAITVIEYMSSEKPKCVMEKVLGHSKMETGTMLFELPACCKHEKALRKILKRINNIDNPYDQAHVIFKEIIEEALTEET